MSHSPGPWKWVKGAWDLRALTDASDKVILEAGSSQDMHVYDDQAAAIIAAAPELLSMLREIEWRGDCGSCIECGSQWKAGGEYVTRIGNHAPDCRLAALLRRFP